MVNVLQYMSTDKYSQKKSKADMLIVGTNLRAIFEELGTHTKTTGFHCCHDACAPVC